MWTIFHFFYLCSNFGPTSHFSSKGWNWRDIRHIHTQIRMWFYSVAESSQGKIASQINISLQVLIWFEIYIDFKSGLIFKFCFRISTTGFNREYFKGYLFIFFWKIEHIFSKFLGSDKTVKSCACNWKLALLYSLSMYDNIYDTYPILCKSKTKKKNALKKLDGAPLESSKR